MNKDQRASGAEKVLRYITCYLLWGILSGLGLWNLAMIRRIATVALGMYGIGRWLPTTLMAALNAITIVLGLLWLAGVVLLESYLRNVVMDRRLWKRTLVVSAAEAVVLGLCYGIQFLLI
jgi:hypothetical protein